MLESVGKYRIMGEIARGGMGIVYKAEDPILKRVVAIKQLSLVDTEVDRKDEYLERFRREAVLAANLNHPNIVSIFDISINEQGAFYVMEFLRGITLGNELQRRKGNRMHLAEFWPIFKQICKGLSYAGVRKLVHRDIKPDNIFLLADGLAKITDFGIAFSTETKLTRLTKPGSFLGTICYMSPEQLEDSGSVDQRADIYSLAALSYEVLSGVLPFSPDVGMHKLMTAIVSKDAPPLHLINTEIPFEISRVISVGMRKLPEERYSSAEEFEKEFEKAMSAPKGSKRPLLAASDGRSSGRFAAFSAQFAERLAQGNSQYAENLSAAAGEQLGRIFKRGPAKFYALTNSIPLVKHIGEIKLEGGLRTAKIEPVAICARKGKLAVADMISKSIKIFGANGALEAETRCTPSNKIGSKTIGGMFSKPAGIALDVTGKIYATDAADQYVRVYDSQGWFVREFQNKQGSPGDTSGLFIDDVEGCIYLTDAANGSIHCLRSDLGTWIRTFGTKGQRDGQFQKPLSMTVDGFGYLYVLDQETCKISIFTKTGLYQRGWGSQGSTRGAFNKPGGIAIDQADRIYVADTLNNRILVFSSAGDYLYVFGGAGSEPGQFRAPQDITVDLENNRLYVLDNGNRRIQIFDIFMEENKKN